MSLICRLAAALLAFNFSACAALPTHYERADSHAVTGTQDTRLGKVLAPRIAAQPPGTSGFHPLITGTDALAARIGLVRVAQKSIDAQYYIWHDDTAGKLLVSELLQAADRGVRVRLLLDDLDTAGKDHSIRLIDAHPRIEIRLFNPFANRTRRFVDFVTDLARVNRRMHNKSLTADSLATIVGGRNIGNEYFGGESEAAFADLDVLGIGPVAREVAAAFDLYWNSEWAIPVAAFAPEVTVAPEELAQARRGLARFVADAQASAYVTALGKTALVDKTQSGDVDFEWGKASLLVDSPSKAAGIEVAADTHIGPRLQSVFAQVKNELIVVSPYFVPGDALVEDFARMVERGVRVRILTNSLAASDVGVVHAGYMRYRKDLLRNGVELYEFKPGLGDLGHEESGRSLSGSSRASLHAKTLAGDRKLLFVGSFNLDPRSVALNTEMGVLFEGPRLASTLGRAFDHDLLAKAYRVQLAQGSDALRWTTLENGREMHFDTEPETGWWQRFVTRILSIFVVEGML